MAWGLGARLVGLLCGVLALAPVPSWGQQTLRGVALVIGQSDYGSISDLPNAERDADAIETLLGDLGFDASSVADRDARRLTRDLDSFLADAEGADVAVIYYAGHAVEVGGENYLVPTDADVSSPDKLAEILIPLGNYVSSLQSKAKVTIVLLDACRDNPFPAGTTIRRPGDAAPLLVSSTGLQSRGVVAMTRASTAKAGLGIVVGFAAEPGKAALDGEPGSNSPYAAALLRHLAAMAGEEFGTVMRMVAQEVYLKTGGRQRPWVNESLQRLLYFGEPAPDPIGDEGDILKERRQLLLTIADLPDVERRQVETAAADAGVPMDALYGMLKMLGARVPDDATQLGDLLRTEGRRLETILAERKALDSPDQEIVRLTALADSAENEGLLVKAQELRERAKARYRDLEPNLEDQQERLDARFIEGAAVFARSAESSALVFDYVGAAADYREAFARVDGRDADLAWRYKLLEAESLYDQGRHHNDNAALERAVVGARQAMALAETALRTLTVMPPGLAGSDDVGRVAKAFETMNALPAASQRDRIARAQHDLGNMLQELGERLGDDTLLRDAEASYAAALGIWTPLDHPAEWTRAMGAVAVLKTTLGERQSGTAGLLAAVSAFEDLFASLPPKLSETEIATLRVNYGRALLLCGTREGSVDRVLAAAEAFSRAINSLPRAGVPLDWAAAQNNFGAALLAAYEIDGNPGHLDRAREAFEQALLESTHKRSPAGWAEARHNLGVTLYRIGVRSSDAATLEASAAALRDVLGQWTRDASPLQWALATSNLANTLSDLGQIQGETDGLRAAVTAYREALLEWTRERAPNDWARTQSNLGKTLMAVAAKDDGTEDLRAAIAAFEAALLEWTRESAPEAWASTQRSLGGAWQTLWRRDSQPGEIEAAIEAYRLSTEIFTRERDLVRWSDARDKIGVALILLGLQLKSKDRVLEGRTVLVSLRDTMRQEGHAELDDHFRERLKTADQVLATFE